MKLQLLKYRDFNEEYLSDAKYSFKDNDSKSRLKLVLDGQQRLQSLFIALNGRLNNKILYFDLLSGKRADDFREVFFIFRFMTNSKASDFNKKTIERRNENNNNEEEGKFPVYVTVKGI